MDSVPYQGYYTINVSLIQFRVNYWFKNGIVYCFLIIINAFAYENLNISNSFSNSSWFPFSAYFVNSDEFCSYI